MDKTIKTLTEVLQESKKEGTSPYDTTAEVVRIDGQTAWCHIAGGIDETPVTMTIAASVGDTVQVRIAGGRAWITGNASAPPTDDTIAKEARTKANSAEVISESAKTQAEAAARVAGNTSQHFWFTETGLDTGAHITEKTKEEFISDPSNGGGNLLARSNGVAIRDGLDELAQFLATGVKISDIGGGYSLTLTTSGLSIVDSNNDTVLNIAVDIMGQVKIQGNDGDYLTFPSRGNGNTSLFSTGDLSLVADGGVVGIGGLQGGISLGSNISSDIIAEQDIIAYGYIKAFGDITANDHSSPIGDRQVRQNTTTKSTGTTWTTVSTSTVYVDITAGTWVIHGFCSYEANATGVRALRLYNNTAALYFEQSEDVRPAVSGSATRLQCTATATATTDATIVLQTYQNSGGTRSVTYSIEAVRIA